MFDTGTLRDNPTAAAEVMYNLMEPIQDPSTLTGFPEARIPILRVHDAVWRRIQEVSISHVII